MSNGFVVHISQCFNNIFQILGGIFNIDHADFVETVKKGPSVHVLHNQINELLLFEDSKEFDDVRMVETGMKSNLFDELVNHFILFHLALLDPLNCCDKARLMVPR